MARVDYYDIECAVAAALENDENLAECGAKVLVEQTVTFERGRYIIVLPTRRQAPDAMQSISAGRRTRFLFTITIWCWAFELDVAKANRARDDLLGLVEIALMADHRFGRDDIKQSWITGGDFDLDEGEGDQGFASGGSIELVIDVSAVTA